MAELTRLVLQIMRSNAPARDDDRLLLVEYYNREGVDLSERQVDRICSLHNPSSLTRVRARLQRSGLFPRTPPAQEKRRRGAQDEEERH